MDYFISSDAYHIDRDGNAYTRRIQSKQINTQFTEHMDNDSTIDNDGDMVDYDDDIIQDGFAQGWFTESLVRMHSIGLSFDR